MPLGISRRFASNLIVSRTFRGLNADRECAGAWPSGAAHREIHGDPPADEHQRLLDDRQRGTNRGIAERVVGHENVGE